MPSVAVSERPSRTPQTQCSTDTGMLSIVHHAGQTLLRITEQHGIRADELIQAEIRLPTLRSPFQLREKFFQQNSISCLTCSLSQRRLVRVHRMQPLLITPIVDLHGPEPSLVQVGLTSS